jgi:hypothetical protein
VRGKVDRGATGARRLLSAWAVTAAMPCLAMHMVVAPPMLYMSGPVVYEDWTAWQEIMDKHGSKIDTVVLYDSPGGESMPSRFISPHIRARKLKTVVAGPCASACANMFVAGVERQFASGANKSVLVFHGSYRENDRSVVKRSHGDYFLRMTDWKMSEALVLRFINLPDPSGGLMFFHPQLKPDKLMALVALCDGKAVRAKRLDQCETIPETDALAQGVVTTWETRNAGTLPEAGKDWKTKVTWPEAAAAAQEGTPPPQ